MGDGGGRTIVFFPEGAYGPTNNCVGIGDVLRRRGHRVVFIVEEIVRRHARGEGLRGTDDAARAAAGRARGPRPVLDRLHPRHGAGLPQADDRAARRVHRRRRCSALIDGAKFVDERLREIIDELAPDAIVEDNVVAFPALAASGRPWARIASCNPAEIKDPAVPPFSSGYPAADRSAWPALPRGGAADARRPVGRLRRVLPRARRRPR